MKPTIAICCRRTRAQPSARTRVFDVFEQYNTRKIKKKKKEVKKKTTNGRSDGDRGREFIAFLASCRSFFYHLYPAEYAIYSLLNLIFFFLLVNIEYRV